MTKNLMRVAAIVAACGAINLVEANEFRSPLATERGGLRYVFEEQNEDDYRLQFWSSTHSREANRAFLKHGTDTKQLSALFFNESDFRLSKIFPDCRVPINTEFYNPYMRILKLSPRVDYSESGASFGGRIDFPVWKNKGRMGVRGTVPIRNIKLEREDLDDTQIAETEDVVLRQVAPLLVQGEGIDPNTAQPRGNTVVAAKDIRAYRFDLVEALPQNNQYQSMLQYDSGGVAGKVEIATQSAYSANITTPIDDDPSGDPNSIPTLVLVSSVEGEVPRNNAGVALQGGTAQAQMFGLPVNLEVDANAVVGDRFVFHLGDAYASDADDNNSGTGTGIIATVDQRIALQDTKATLWVTTVHDATGAVRSDTQNAITSIEDALQEFDESPYDWMVARGMKFATSEALGIGDIDIDLFYSHRFSRDFLAEFMVGIRFPTGTGKHWDKNPYRAHLGNGEHYEIKLGAMAALQASEWLGIKLDAYWSFVLESTEHRAAAFSGARIKNIGPLADADVDWGYLVARLDFNFTHSKDENLHSLFGYEFYYKTRDSVHFKVSSMQSWLGREKDVTSTAITFNPLLYDLDNSVLEKNTEAICHRFRWETAYEFSPYVGIFGGGSWTFAGQNIAREQDLFAGMNVKFD